MRERVYVGGGGVIWAHAYRQLTPGLLGLNQTGPWHTVFFLAHVCLLWLLQAH